MNSRSRRLSLSKSWVQRLCSIREFEQIGFLFEQMCLHLRRPLLHEVFCELDALMHQREPRARRIVHGIFVRNLKYDAQRCEVLADLPRSPLVIRLRHQSNYDLKSAWKRVEPEQFFSKDDRVLTLGERRSLARSSDISILNRLLTDPDGTVISHLLKNPRVTRAMVLNIATRRPISAGALVAVFGSSRFGVSQGLQNAMIYNPHLPYAIAIPLLALMTTKDLRGLREIASLSPFVQRGLIAEINLRRSATL